MLQSADVLDRYASAAAALSAAHGGLSWIAAADQTALTSEERGDLLRGLTALDAVKLAADTAVLGAFQSLEDYALDGQASAAGWAAWQGRTSRQSVSAKLKWSRRLSARPHVRAALASGLLSPPWAGQILAWLNQLPPEVQGDAEDILVAAALGGADLAGLSSLFEEIRARTARPDTDPGDDAGDSDGFSSRSLQLDEYFRGNGALRGDLTPEAATALRAVLDALGARKGPEDTRTRPQRDHDALAEACRLLAGSGFLPQRAGQPVQIVLHMTLSQLLGQAEDNPALAAWLKSRGMTAPPGAACDAQIVPVVIGSLDPDVASDLDTLAEVLGYAGDGDGSASDFSDRGADGAAEGDTPGSASDSGFFVPGGAGAGDLLPGGSGVTGSGASLPADGASLSSGSSTGAGGSLPGSGLGLGLGLPASSGSDGGSLPFGADGMPFGAGAVAGVRLPPGAGGLDGDSLPLAGDATWLGASVPFGGSEARQRAVFAAVRLLSGPPGAAAWLRRQAGPPVNTVSIPLDAGRSTAAVSPVLRRLVVLRDGKCRFPGCEVAPAGCQAHHVKPWAAGGRTEVSNLVLLCGFHHQVVVHRQGWRLELLPDGTTRAASPDGRRVLHSHIPPSAA